MQLLMHDYVLPGSAQPKIFENSNFEFTCTNLKFGKIMTKLKA